MSVDLKVGSPLRCDKHKFYGILHNITQVIFPEQESMELIIAEFADISHYLGCRVKQ